MHDNIKTDYNYLFELNYLTVIKVTGNNVATFLQGQLTCDINKINNHSRQLGALCAVNGRILALLEIIYWNDYFMVIPTDLLLIVMKALTNVAKLSKITLTHLEDTYVFGYYGRRQPLLNYDKFLCCNITNNQYLIITQESQHLIDNLSQNANITHSLSWHLLNLKNKYVNIYTETSGLFLPHQLNLHQTDCISFNKGCYKGQEIIARMHYRATLKHNLNFITVSTQEIPKLGESLHENNKSLGIVVDYCQIYNTQDYLIAIIQHKN